MPISSEQLRQMKYLVIIEKGESGYGAYVPDLPGCTAAAASREEVMGLIQEAIEFHIEDLVKTGQPVPPAASRSEIVEIHAA